MVNQEISRLFETIADALEFKGENPFRVLAYRRGAEAVADLDEDLTVLVYESRLTDVPGIGKGLAHDVSQYLSENRMDAYHNAMEGIPPKLLELKKLSGLGPKRLALLHRKLGIRDQHTLKRALEDGSVAELPGLGPKVVENLKRSLERFAKNRERMTIAEALALSREILGQLADRTDVSKAVFAGSLRRCRETCGDLDLLIPSKKSEEVVRAFATVPGVEQVLAAGDTKGSILFGGGRQIDLRVVAPASFGAALCYFTGSKDHNVRLREIAKKKGLKVNEYGVFRGETSVAGKKEEDVYAVLDLPWIPPEMRENRGEIEAAREGTLPDVIKPRDIRGDLHLHTNWSNGSAPVLAMVQAAMERGYKYVAITDHSAAAAYANGLDAERVAEQAKDIEVARKAVDGIKVLHGLEVDITPAGELDVGDDVLSRLDWVVAAVHTGYRSNVTDRLLKAMDNPHVDAVAHPTGRLIGRREGYSSLDMDLVLEKAAETGTALEINASPDRLDLSAETARRAAAKGVRIVINSDAKDVAAMGNMDLGVKVARRGWLTKESVVNTRPLSRVRKGK